MLVDEPQVRRWTKSEYHQAAEMGWFAGQRVELINGEVIEMAPQKDAHAYAVRLAASAMQQRCAPDKTVLVQMPLNLGPASEPEPDVAVVKGALREVRQHPTGAELIIEVADTSLAYDRGTKAALYASRSVAEYWIVNLPDRQIEVHRLSGARYAAPEIYQHGQSIASPFLASPVDVAELMPE